MPPPTEAEPFLPVFMADHNRRFAIPPRVAHDAHRALHPDDDLTQIFTLQESRLITAKLTVNYKRGLYLLEDTVENRRLRRTVRPRERSRRRHRHDPRQRSRAPLSAAAAGPGRPRARRRRRARASRWRLRLDRRAAARARCRAPRQPQDLAAREAADSDGRGAGVIRSLPGSRPGKPDISTLEKTRHFYFVLTSRSVLPFATAPSSR